jgi:hypothetical protein
MRQIQRRIEKLEMLFPVKPTPTPEQAVSQMALQQISGEDLMVLRSIIKAGRSLPSTERESQAVAAFRSAVERATGLINDKMKHAKPSSRGYFGIASWPGIRCDKSRGESKSLQCYFP